MNKLSIFYLFVFCTLLLAGGCTDDGCLSDTDTPVFLQPSFSTASNVSARSIVNETGTATGQVNKIGVYLTRTDGHTAYADPAMVYTTFTTTNGTTGPEQRNSTSVPNRHASMPGIRIMERPPQNPEPPGPYL